MGPQRWVLFRTKRFCEYGPLCFYLHILQLIYQRQSRNGKQSLVNGNTRQCLTGWTHSMLIETQHVTQGVAQVDVNKGCHFTSNLLLLIKHIHETAVTKNDKIT